MMLKASFSKTALQLVSRITGSIGVRTGTVEMSTLNFPRSLLSLMGRLKQFLVPSYLSIVDQIHKSSVRRFRICKECNRVSYQECDFDHIWRVMQARLDRCSPQSKLGPLWSGGRAGGSRAVRLLTIGFAELSTAWDRRA